MAGVNGSMYHLVEGGQIRRGTSKSERAAIAEGLKTGVYRVVELDKQTKDALSRLHTRFQGDHVGVEQVKDRMNMPGVNDSMYHVVEGGQIRRGTSKSEKAAIVEGLKTGAYKVVELDKQTKDALSRLHTGFQGEHVGVEQNMEFFEQHRDV